MNISCSAYCCSHIWDEGK